MRSLVTFSVVALVGCSAAPGPQGEEDAGFYILPAEPDAGADAQADAKADAHTEASAPKPSCPNVPEDVSSFKPSAPKPARPFQAACGAGQVTSFYEACNASYATDYTCQSWESASASNNACATCMISDEYDATWGPIVNHSYYAHVNQVGCAELLTQNPAPAGTCAYTAWSTEACQIDACDSLCSTDTWQMEDACEKNALAGGCKSYSAAQTAACVTTTGAFNKCFVSDPQTQFVNVGSTFCGGS